MGQIKTKKVMKKATLITTLIGIGVEKSTAEKIASLTPDDGVDGLTVEEITDFNAKWKNDQRELWRNDSELVDALKGAEKAKNLEMFERKMRQEFGLTSEETKDKKFDEIVTLAKEKNKKTGDKTKEELEAKVLELTGDLKKLNDEEIPRIKSEVEIEKKTFHRDNKFRSAIPTKDKEGKDLLRLPFDTVHKLIKMDLDEKFDYELDDKNEWVIKEKGKDLRAKNADGTKFLTMDEFVTSRLEAHGAIVKSNAKPGEKKPGDTSGTIVIDGDKKVVSPGLKKAQEHEAKLRSEREG